MMYNANQFLYHLMEHHIFYDCKGSRPDGKQSAAERHKLYVAQYNYFLKNIAPLLAQSRKEGATEFMDSSVTKLAEQLNNHLTDCRTLMRKGLSAGGYFGFGYADRHAREPTVILPRLWLFLKLDFNNDSASADGVSYHGLTFVVRDELTEPEAADLVKMLQEAEQEGTEQAPTEPPEMTGTDTAGTEKAPTAQENQSERRGTLQAVAFAEFLKHLVDYGGYTPQNLPFNAVTAVAVFNKRVDGKYRVTVKNVPGFVHRNRLLFCKKLGVTDIAFSKDTQSAEIQGEIKLLIEDHPFKPTC